MPDYEKYSSFYPNADVSAEECALRLAPIIAPTEYAFIVPTQTGLKKSILDAIAGVRAFLSHTELHDYDSQLQGPENKAIFPAFFVMPNGFVETKATLYRPFTKQGDPRIWFSKLNDYANAGNLLLLSTFEGALFIFNLSRKEIWESISNKGIAYGVLVKAKAQANSARDELIRLLKDINARGWLPSVTAGDPGVGDTLENALGIRRNNSRLPDFKGIELKATRLTKNGKHRTPTRNTLFSKTPDHGLDYHHILDVYGKMQAPGGNGVPRLQIYETFSTKRVNGYDLFLGCDKKTERVLLLYSSEHTLADPSAIYVSSWDFETLKRTFANKHPETMWIGAESKIVNGQEFFRYTLAQYTSKPNPDALIDLISSGIVTLDLTAHIEPDGRYRDHGMLWKIGPNNRALIVGTVLDIKLAP